MKLPNFDSLIGDVNWVRPKRSAKNAVAIAVISTVVSLVAVASIGYGYLSFYNPQKLVDILANVPGLIALGVGGSIVCMLFGLGISFLGKSDFTVDHFTVNQSFSNKYRELYLNKGDGGGEGENKIYDERVSEALDKIMHPFEYGAGSQDTVFEKYVTGILKSLSVYASRSEETATKLLDKGVAFMAGGLFFYIVSIIVWQFYAKMASPADHLLYVGMIACSTTFLVIEFLAAWFFKQYRYYVDVSMSCLRVRSVYDRYLLTFYSLKEFGDGGEIARDKMQEMLREDVKWPSYQASTRNDFNHMVESVGALNSSLEKVKQLFQNKGSGGNGQ